jgi:serine/threonine-protein phosphatase PGAM5
MATRTIYLIRHGQYDSKNSHNDKLAGGLTPIGVEQVKLTAQRLRSLPISAIHCSSLQRAVETAEIIAREFPDVPLYRSQLLWECVPCIPRNFTELFADIPLETIEQDRQQAERAFDRYFKRARGKDKHEIVVCHGQIIRYFVCRVLQLQPEAWVDMDMSNCGISEVLIETDGRMVLVSHNDVGHLPQHLITSLIGVRAARALYGLAQIALDQGDFVEAQRQGQESLAIFERIGHEDAAKVKEWLEGLPVMERRLP